MPRHKGIVAAGHTATAQTAAAVLADGGNAFDAIVAAFFTACVAEPVLSSLGGGGFALVRPAAGKPRIYDFFVQTPRRQRPAADCDFYPILADFGTVQQEFHIGYGAAATPGAVRGVFALQRDLGRMRMPDLVAPACAHARQGIAVNALQAYIFSVVAPIYTGQAASRQVFGSQRDPTRTLGEGEVFRLPELADLMENLALEGEQLFYLGEVAQRIVERCRSSGGQLDVDDLRAYNVELREPLCIDYKGARVLTNPPPSSGGILIAFALGLLEPLALAGAGFGSAQHLLALARAMAATAQARVEAHLDGDAVPAAERLLDTALLARYRRQVHGRPAALRGTTHISVLDGTGNAAAMTLSNGEGCGHMLPECGFMLNNMLGEEDLNPGGFHRWSTDTRMTSMMAPSMLLDSRRDRQVVLGSGGSNRIRSAILQVLLNLQEFEQPLAQAVDAPRIHFEADVVNLESGFEAAATQALEHAYPGLHAWPNRNLFFGGAHSVARIGNQFEGAGDRRRGGVCIVV